MAIGPSELLDHASASAIALREYDEAEDARVTEMRLYHHQGW